MTSIPDFPKKPYQALVSLERNLEASASRVANQKSAGKSLVAVFQWQACCLEEEDVFFVCV